LKQKSQLDSSLDRLAGEVGTSATTKRTPYFFYFSSHIPPNFFVERFIGVRLIMHAVRTEEELTVRVEVKGANDPGMCFEVIDDMLSFLLRLGIRSAVVSCTVVSPL